MSPTVSVVIPCYNAAPFLHETLESALNQTHPPLEVIVVNDGSTDDSATIAKSFGPPVKVIYQENQGESVARNRGIDEAKGDWIAFLDADDIWSKEKLKKQVQMIQDNLIAIHTNHFLFGSSNKIVDFSYIHPNQLYSPEFIALNTPLHPSTLLVRKKTSPRFPVWTKHAEDLIYQLELSLKGKVKLVQEPLAGYRKHFESQSQSDPLIAVKRHRTLDKWLRENRSRLTPKEVEIVQTKWLNRLAGMAWKEKDNRNWKQYWNIRKYLRKFSGYPSVDLILNNRIYPKWFYSLKDFLPFAKFTNQ